MVSDRQGNIICVKFGETSSKRHTAVERRGSGRTYANMSGMTMRIANLVLQCEVQLKRPGGDFMERHVHYFDGTIRCMRAQTHNYMIRLNLLNLKFVPGLNIWGMTPHHWFLRNQCVSLVASFSRLGIRGVEAWTHYCTSGCLSHGPSFRDKLQASPACHSSKVSIGLTANLQEFQQKVLKSKNKLNFGICSTKINHN